MTALHDLARILGGKAINGQVCCPGPGHSPSDRSLVVRPAPSMPDGFIVHSHCGDDWRACRDHVLGLLGRTSYQPPPRLVRPAARPRSTQSWALQIWRDSVDPHGTPVEHYLASRNLKLPDDAERFIRFHSACPWADDNNVRVRVPAMVALFRTITGDEPAAIQRTALRPDGSKIGRKMLGPVIGAAIKVTSDDDVLLRLGVAEGLESAMSAIVLGQGPAWALGSAGAIRNLPVLPAIETLALIAEHDRANEDARDICGSRWQDAGCQVLVVEPSNRAHKDLNDVLQQKRNAR
jgi:Toprim domain-containing protein